MAAPVPQTISYNFDGRPRGQSAIAQERAIAENPTRDGEVARYTDFCR